MAVLGNMQDSPDLPKFAKPCCADSPESLTFAETCCGDSPDSSTFAKPCCADSPDSRKVSLASVMQIWRVWQVWRIWRVQARPFYAYKICYLCLKRPILSCALVLTFAELCCADSPVCRHSPSRVTRTRQTCRHLPSRVARTRQTWTLAEPCCVDSPDSPTLTKGHFQEKCDSPRQIRASNERVSRIWREWLLLN